MGEPMAPTDVLPPSPTRAGEAEGTPPSASLSTAAASRGERTLAFGVMLLAAVAFLAAAPFARVRLPEVWAFIPIYQSALTLNELITAVLLLAQFRIVRSR